MDAQRHLYIKCSSDSEQWLLPVCDGVRDNQAQTQLVGNSDRLKESNGGMIMKNLHFYELNHGEKKYIRGWVNWTGEVPEKGDVVLLHFGDYNEEELMYLVVNRVFNGLRPDYIDIIVEKIEKGGLTNA